MADITTLLCDIRGYAYTHSTPVIDLDSWGYLKGVILKQKPKHILEIGSAIGWSTLAIADLINRWGGDLMSCEISFPSYKMACHYQYLSKVYNYSIYFTDYCKISRDYFSTQLDFVFIDGQKNEYLQYYLTLTTTYISIRDHQKQIYTQAALLADSYTLVFDDVIKFAKKIKPLVDHLDEKGIPYEIVQTTGDDGFLVIENIQGS